MKVKHEIMESDPYQVKKLQSKHKYNWNLNET